MQTVPKDNMESLNCATFITSPPPTGSSTSCSGRLRSRTISYKPFPPLFQQTTIHSSNANTNHTDTASSAIPEIISHGLVTPSRRRSNSAITQSQYTTSHQSPSTLLSNQYMLLDKYEEDLSEKYNKIESSNLSIKNLFNKRQKKVVSGASLL